MKDLIFNPGFKMFSRLLLVVGCVVPAFFFAAMYFCVGGYSWCGEFISGSGLVAINGKPNTLSAILLSCGLVLSGVLCAGYFIMRASCGKGSRWLRIPVGVCGVAGGIGLIGIGIFPFDVHPDIHNFCTLCWIPFSLAMLASSFTPSDRFGSRREKLIWLVYLLYGLAISGTLNWLVDRPPYPLPHRPTGPLVQKIMVVGFYIYMLGQVIRANCTPGDPRVDRSTKK